MIMISPVLQGSEQTDVGIRGFVFLGGSSAVGDVDDDEPSPSSS